MWNNTVRVVKLTGRRLVEKVSVIKTEIRDIILDSSSLASNLTAGTTEGESEYVYPVLIRLDVEMGLVSSWQHSHSRQS